MYVYIYIHILCTVIREILCIKWLPYQMTSQLSLVWDARQCWWWQTRNSRSPKPFTKKKREEQKLDSHLRAKKRSYKESTKCWSKMGSHLPTCEINHEPGITKPLTKKKKKSPSSWVKTLETSKIRYENSQKSLICFIPSPTSKRDLSGWFEQNRRRHPQRNTPLHAWPVCLRSLIASSWSPGLKRRWQEGILRNPGLENRSSTRLQSF